MKITLLAMLVGLSASASAIGTSMGPATVGATEDTVTIRVNMQTGAAEIQEGSNWVALEAVAREEAEATVQKTQYYGGGYVNPYATPCGQVYADPCTTPCNTGCGNAVPYYQVPNVPYVYTQPYAVQPYYAPRVTPYYVRPNNYYYNNGYGYYGYGRPRVYNRRTW